MIKLKLFRFSFWRLFSCKIWYVCIWIEIDARFHCKAIFRGFGLFRCGRHYEHGISAITSLTGNDVFFVLTNVAALSILIFSVKLLLI